MLTLLGRKQERFCDGLSRRSFLRVGALGLGGLSLPQLLEASPDGGRSNKSVIMIYLPGGPPQQDMVDPKPDAPAEIRTPFGTINTVVPGIQFTELMPRLAQMLDRYNVIRTLVGADHRHEAFQCYTGRLGGRIEDNAPDGGWPTFGSVVAKLQGSSVSHVPPYIDVGPRLRHAPYRNAGRHDTGPLISWPGCLGMRYVPFLLAGQDNKDVVLSRVSGNRLQDRRNLLSAIDRFRRDVDQSEVLDGLDVFRQQALGILSSSRLAEALDLEREDPRILERYGEGGTTNKSFGGAPTNPQLLLMARRLVQAGARCVTVAFGAWDWHGNRGGPVEKLGPEDIPWFDHALATLIEDLDQQDLLDDVSVVAWGEFGRTPRINEKGGRDHWIDTACAFLAGGGMPGGQVIGATDKNGADPVDRPVHFQEVFATLYHNVGIDVHTTTITDQEGRPHFLVDEGRGPLPELM